MKKDEIKKMLCDAVDLYAPEVKLYEADTARHPELGFEETYTATRLTDELEKLGLSVRKNIAITGLRADIVSSCAGPKIAILGELDGIVCRKAKHAHPVTGASHACGHNLQTSIALTCAAALAKTKAMEKLCGTISIMGTPAEEFIEIDTRNEMRKAGKIHYLCGKPEFVRLGVFDDIDMSMMIHAGEKKIGAGFAVPDLGNGFRVFMIQFKGVQSHAAAAPDQGINALYAAVAGINAVNALRETFRDDDHIRVHFIITKGGDSVNSVPDDVRLEGYVRAAKSEVIDEMFDKVIRAFRAGATALGAECLVNSIPGDMPLNMNKALNDVFIANATTLVGEENMTTGITFFASTDMGDIAQLMPSIHPLAGGTFGPLHSSDFYVSDFEAAVLIPAKALLNTIVDLLYDDAKLGKSIVSNFTPKYTKDTYLAAMDSRFFSEIL